ncbi:hypothetical protein [Paraburkholderia aspalathi]|jgi:hypothetical protein|uniref:hypothetical protein n=1 Tax=Paraburkholderia aspalathi TaxID=1324617 RepID=UPI0038BAF72F
MGASDDEWALWMRRRVREAVELLARGWPDVLSCPILKPLARVVMAFFFSINETIYVLLEEKVSETTLPKTAEEALTELQSLARYVCAKTSS